MSSVIRIVGLSTGQTTGFDGQWLVEYDPGRDGCEPLSGWPMFAHVVTTPDIAAATRYDDATQAFEVYRAVDPRRPVRDDGRPNRPLTAFTVEVYDPDLQSSAVDSADGDEGVGTSSNPTFGQTALCALLAAGITIGLILLGSWAADQHRPAAVTVPATATAVPR